MAISSSSASMRFAIDRSANFAACVGRRSEARVDRADLLRGDEHVDVGEPAAAVLRGKHAERDPALVRLDVRGLRQLEGAQRVGLGVRPRTTGASTSSAKSRASSCFL